jgi:hypothetical protein
MFIKNILIYKSLISLVFVLIFQFSSNAYADTCGPDFTKGIEQYRMQNYEEDIKIFDTIAKSRNKTDKCNSNALIYIGICKNLSGNSNSSRIYRGNKTLS